MEYFRKLRDYVLGEDLSIDSEHAEQPPSRRSPSSRRPAQHARPAQQAQRARWDPQQQQPRRPQPRQHSPGATSPAAEAVPPTAALPRGPGVLRDVDDGASGGVQGLSWYRARLQQDADGDVAEQFLTEATTQLTAGGQPMGKPEYSLEVQRKRLRRPQTGSMRVEKGNVDVEIREEDSQ